MSGHKFGLWDVNIGSRIKNGAVVFRIDNDAALLGALPWVTSSFIGDRRNKIMNSKKFSSNGLSRSGSRASPT
jgi:hypothetical protein